MQAIGLKTHIWNNAAKTVLLLLGFPFLMLMIVYACNLVYVAFFENPAVLEGLNEAVRPGDALRHLVGVVGRRQAGADVQELADPGLGREEADRAAGELAGHPGA